MLGAWLVNGGDGPAPAAPAVPDESLSWPVAHSGGTRSARLSHVSSQVGGVSVVGAMPASSLSMSHWRYVVTESSL